MRKIGLKFFLALLLCSFFKVYGQELNYDQVNVQGQLFSSSSAETDFEFLIIGIAGDTIWRESHAAVPLNEQGAFSLAFGTGTFIQGLTTEFNAVNWLNASRVELYHIGDSRYLQGAYHIQSVPYALHSLHIEPLATVDLVDVSTDDYEVNQFLIFDGMGWFVEVGALSDSTIFAWFADTVSFADTAGYALNNDFADSALYAYYADTASFVTLTDTALYADTVAYVDSSNFAMSALNNWSVFGDEDRVDTNFVGSSNMEALHLRTNNSNRFSFEDDFSIHNDFPGIGFRFNTQRGALFTPNTNSGVSEIPGTYMYMDGETASFHGGSSPGLIDSLKGAYSFAWGENVGTNGPNSTVFGKDTYGDTALFGAMLIPYASVSSFAAGRNCHVSHMGVAIGDSAISGYYRNIAIGKNVTSTTASAGIGIGNNVLVVGATSWAVGNNITASGHFSTAIGTNASTDYNNGSFVFGDNSTTDTVKNTAANQFMARAAGGYVFYSSSDLTMGVELLPGAGSWSMISDRNKKRNIQKLAASSYNETFKTLPISSWNYIGTSTTHIGPMAQDFYRTFNVGEKPYLINMIDSDGVAFLGIKMLHERVEGLPTEKEIETLEEEIKNEKKEIEEIELRINQLYEELDHN